jgi:hypothetical protein
MQRCSRGGPEEIDKAKGCGNLSDEFFKNQATAALDPRHSRQSRECLDRNDIFGREQEED